MAGEVAKTGSWLSKTFNSVVKHMFSPTMIFMMMAMAFPMASMAASTAGATATLGDIGLATADMYVEMFKAPFTDGGVMLDAFGNAADGNFAANSYEWGMMDGGHGGHSDMSDHAMTGSDHSDHVVTAHGTEDIIDHSKMHHPIDSVDQVNKLQSDLSNEELRQALDMADRQGISLSEYLLDLM